MGKVATISMVHLELKKSKHNFEDSEIVYGAQGLFYALSWNGNLNGHEQIGWLH